MTTIQRHNRVPINPSVRLFGPMAVLMHSLLFTPLVGAIAVGLNWKRLGDSTRGALSAIGGLAAPLILLGLGWSISPIAAIVGLVAGAIGLSFGWHREQSTLFESHFASGGTKAASWPLTLLGVVVVGACAAWLSTHPELIDSLKKTVQSF